MAFDIRTGTTTGTEAAGTISSQLQSASSGGSTISGGQSSSSGGSSSRGSSSRRRVSPPSPTVSVSGTTVFINGVGYSVAPSQQEEFIRSKGGRISSSTQQKIQSSIQAEQQRRQQIQQQIQQQKLQPLSVSEAQPIYERSFQIGKDVPPPRPRYTKQLFKQAGREFFLAEQYKTPIDSFGTLFSPFTTSERKGEVGFTYGTSFGTIQSGTAVKGSGTPTRTTGFQLLREEGLDPNKFLPPEIRYQQEADKISKELIPPIQEKINTGELSFEQGQAQLEKQFEERTAKIDTTKFKGGDFTKQVKKAQQPAFSGRKFGEYAGIGAASLTPTGAAIVGVSFVAKGTPKITKGLFNKDLKFKERSVLVGTGAIEAGLGFAGGGLAVKGVERSADKLLIEEITSKEGTVRGTLQESKQGKALFRTTSKSNLGSEASIRTDLIAPVFRTVRKPVTSQTESGIPIVLEKEEEIFSITGGRGRTQSKIFSVEKGKFIETDSTFSFQSPNLQRGTIIPRQKGKLDIIREGTEGFTGDVFVTQRGKDTFKVKGFGGSSKEIKTDFGTFLGVKGGELESNIIQRRRIGSFIFERDVPTKKVKIQERGLIEVIKQPKETGVEIIQSADIKKTPLSKTFQTPQVSQSQFSPTGLAPQIQKGLIKPAKSLQSPTTTTSTGGLKLTSQTKTRTRTSQLPAIKLSPKLLSPQKTKTFVKSSPAIKSIVSTSSKSSQRVRAIPKIKQQLKQTQVTKSPSPLLPRLNRLTPKKSPLPKPRPKVPLFKINLPNTKPSRSTFKRTRSKTKSVKRQPSLFAIGRNIKAPNIARGESSGIVIRPILTKSKKKKKKMKGGKKKR